MKTNLYPFNCQIACQKHNLSKTCKSVFDSIINYVSLRYRGLSKCQKEFDKSMVFFIFSKLPYTIVITTIIILFSLTF